MFSTPFFRLGGAFYCSSVLDKDNSSVSNSELNAYYFFFYTFGDIETVYHPSRF